MSFAYLSLPSRSVTKEVVCTAYSFEYAAEINSAQLRRQMAHYPYRATQRGLNITIKCRSEVEWDSLKRLIRQHQTDILEANDPTNALFRWVWPEQEMDYTFVVKTVPGGTQRFLVAPELNISAELVYDNLLSASPEYTDTGADYDVITKLTNGDELLKPINWKTPKAGGGGGIPMRATT